MALAVARFSARVTALRVENSTVREDWRWANQRHSQSYSQ